MGELDPEAPPFTLYHTKVVSKCYVDEAILRKAHAYVLRMKFNDEDGVTTIILKVPSMVYHLQNSNQCSRIFFLIGLQNFFALKPVEIDAQRVHQFLTTITKDETCRVNGADGKVFKLKINGQVVTQELRFIHGDHKVSALKLSIEEKKTVFKMQDDFVTKMVYNNLVDHQVRLPLQLYQQHFHLMKPQKYTQPDQHVAYVFTLARKKNMVILCTGGIKC